MSENVISELISIPDNLHRDYIKNALVNGEKKYKIWSFRPKGSDSGFKDPRAFSSYGLEKNEDSGYLDFNGNINNEVLQGNIQKNLGSNFEKYAKESGKGVDADFFSHISPGSENESVILKSLEDATKLKTTGVYYPFSDTFKDFVFNTWYGINPQFTSFFENIPTITVRAYIPSTVFGFVSDAIGDAVETIKDTLAGSSSGKGSIVDKTKETLKEVGEKAIEYYNKLRQKYNSLDAYKNLISQMVGNIGITKGSSFGSHDNMVINLPYILYYKILRSQTNNIYEFPAIVNNIFKSNSYGWSNGGQFNLGEGAGGLLGTILNTIGTTYTPIFDPANNKNDEPVGFTITLDLINDTLDHAKQNYNFVQSLILYNMWIQYGLFSGPGSLYDVKIAGGQRFLMCTGNFSVTNKGILRKIQGAANASNWLPYKEETRVPDVYSLSLEFKSLLPNNLNNYMISVCAGTDTVHPGSVESSIASKLKENIVKALNS